ncbi:MAG TPA: pseudouridine synthase [Candidatus Limnocylindrales bacterium]|nr:pseudouridine synthase [Candidatus Limnocylindrales bacterium]
MAAERLQKIIAAAGIASRRKAEELITGGRVTVNGQVVTELGSKADPATDHIKVDGKLLQGAERHIYLALHKPRGYVTTVTDPEGRPTVMDLVKHVGERVYPVGRLDFNSEGLLILTNDGEFANFLTRADSHVPKTYLVKVAGQPQEEDVEKLRHGIRIGNKPGESGPRSVRTAPAEVRLLREADNPWYEVTLIEGKNRQIRRMFEAIGHHVEKIKRVSYGALKLDLEPGEFRELTTQEIAVLRRPPKQREGEAERPAAKIHARHIGKAALKKGPSQRQRVNRRFGDKGRERFQPEARDERRGAGERREFRSSTRPDGERREFRPSARPVDERRPFAKPDGERRPPRRDERSRGGFAERGRSRPQRDDREQGRREFRGGRPFPANRDRRGPDREDREQGRREFQDRNTFSTRFDRGRPEREEGEGGERDFPRNDRRSGPASRSGKPAFSRSSRPGSSRSGRPEQGQRRGSPGGSNRTGRGGGGFSGGRGASSDRGPKRGGKSPGNRNTRRPGGRGGPRRP